MKRALVYVPVGLEGVVYINAGLVQDQKHLRNFVQQLEWNKEVSTDIRITLAQFQLQSSFYHHLWSILALR